MARANKRKKEGRKRARQTDDPLKYGHERERERSSRTKKKKRSVNETSTCHPIVELYKVGLLRVGKRTNSDERESFVSLLCSRKTNENLVKDQFMIETRLSACLLQTAHLREEQ